VGLSENCYKSPGIDEAAISSWLVQPAADIPDSASGHWDVLRGLVLDGQAAGPLVMDAVLAAIALEHGATVCITDRDFSCSLRSGRHPPRAERLIEFEPGPARVGHAMPTIITRY
jgi:hypothetical protein